MTRAGIDFRSPICFLVLLVVISLSSACVDGQPGNASAESRQLSVESRHHLNTLTVIMEDANTSKKPGARQKLLGEFMARSRTFLETNPWHTNVWLMRAGVAAELNRADDGIEAARNLVDLKADELADPEARRVMAALDRKGWLDTDPPAPSHGKSAIVTRPDSTPITRENPFVNSLGMKFVPLPGGGPLFCVWLTRVQDYAAYAEANSGVDTSWRDPRIQGVAVTPGPTHPVVSVNWNDAHGFCLWLTRRDRREGKIPDGARYRLPTDAEWSKADGLGNREGRGMPREKSEKLPTVFPWGSQWPPPAGAGNFSDASAAEVLRDWEIIDGYHDGFATTSPVGSFKENQFGLYDMSGNAWEWCEDWYDHDHKLRVLRGASWNSRTPKYLLSTYRTSRRHIDRLDVFGFRCVLEGMPAEEGAGR